jgi:hypothetical protein
MTTVDCRALLTAAIGSWHGTYQLWLEPEVLYSESEVEGTVSGLVGDRFVTHEYSYEVLGEPQTGHMLLAAHDADTLQGAWIDSWHNSETILFCAPAGGAAVVGEYGPPDQIWRWRTELAMPSPDELIVTAWNITPDGAEAKATESRYQRIASA